VDNDGRVVRTWDTDYIASGWIYFLDNGHIMRGGSDPGDSGFGGGGAGGRFQEYDWNGNLLWDFAYNDQGRLPHHDIALLPNGNLLAVVWEKKTAEEARAAGRRGEYVPADGVWPDAVLEFQPVRPNGARIVWEWHSWDHVIPSAEAAAHPERIDVNGDFVGVVNPPAMPPDDIWHTNSIAYNPQLDQIILSVPRFNEIWVVDHGTTTAAAAGPAGDLLYH
jgi:hypothetical protein